MFKRQFYNNNVTKAAKFLTVYGLKKPKFRIGQFRSAAAKGKVPKVKYRG